MNPMLGAAVGSVLRFLLAIAAGYLVRGGVWSQTDAALYVEATVLAVLSLGWSQWQKWQARQKLVTALMLAKTTEAKVLDHIVAAPTTVPSVLTPVDVVPVLSGSKR